jgi:hypothetical protein
MKKYTIRWTATTYYTQEVEADNVEDAENKAYHQPIEYDYTSGARKIISVKEIKQ